MSTEANNGAQSEGEARKRAAHDLLRPCRDWLIRRARRALIEHALEFGSVTADEVFHRVGPSPEGIDPRWRGTVPGDLATAGIIEHAGYVKSSRPCRHASILTRWELADRDAALQWLAKHPELPEPDDENEDGEGSGSLAPAPSPTSPPTLATSAIPSNPF